MAGAAIGTAMIGGRAGITETGGYALGKERCWGKDEQCEGCEASHQILDHPPQEMLLAFLT